MGNLLSLVKRTCNGLFFLASAFSRLMLLVMAIDVLYLVFGRYVLRSSPMWGEDLALTCLIWFSLLTVSLSIRERRHMRVEMLLNALPRSLRFTTETANHVFALVFSAVMVVQGVNLCVLNLSNTLSGLGISAFWQYLAVPVSGLLNIVALLEVTKVELWSRTR